MIDVNDNSNANGNGALDPKNEEDKRITKRPARCRSRTNIRRARDEATRIYRRINNLGTIVLSLALS
jgi:hypothetical protein